jgi:hypothetical protein
MIDALKTLFENDVVSSEIKAEIEEAWNSKIQENKMQATAELREEFAKKYEHDKSTMVEAIDSMISERLAEEIAEFADDRKQLAEAKAKYGVAMRENADLLKRFVSESLVKEVSELHEDQKAIADKFSMLENFIVDALATEIAEFHEDKKDLAETKVKLIKEAKNKFAEVRQSFIAKSAAKVSSIVESTLTKEIGALKEDIQSARSNDFGRKMFEAFASEYATSHLNENSETAKLMQVVVTKDKQLVEAKAFALKAKTLAESKGQEVKRITAIAERKNRLNDLMEPLNKGQREIMTDLLESVQTNRLQKSFDKYLPSVIDGNTPAKKAVLSEAKEITGNRDNTTTKTNTSSMQDDNVVDIRRLAGLK